MGLYVREFVPYTEEILQSIIDTSLPVLRFSNRTNGYEIIQPFDFMAKLYSLSNSPSKLSSFTIKKTGSSNTQEVVVSGVAWVDEEKLGWECMFISFQPNEKEIMFAKKFLEVVFAFKVLSQVTLTEHTENGVAFKQGMTEEESDAVDYRINAMMVTNNIEIQFSPFALVKQDIKRLISDNF